MYQDVFIDTNIKRELEPIQKLYNDIVNIEDHNLNEDELIDQYLNNF